MTSDAVLRLADYVESVGDAGRWLVLTHDNPDPDALAAAVAMTRVLRAGFGRRVTAAYGGVIGRAENREMVRSLKLKLSHLRHIRWDRYRHFVLVDTQPRTGNNQLPDRIVPDVVIDHHPAVAGTGLVPVADVRPEYGASATIATEYLYELGLRPTRAEATAIVYAIQTETLEFSREASPADHRAHDACVAIANKRTLAKIKSPSLPAEYFRTLAGALRAAETVDTLVLCHLGHVEQPDMVSEIADFLLRLEGKTWCLCSGLFGDRLFLSIRTTNPRANAGRLMQRLVGKRGRGGGHGMLAGGWISIGADPEPARRRIFRRFARLLKKRPDRIAPLDLSGEIE